MPAALKQRFRNWLFRPKIEHGTVVLTQRRIFILPTRQGLALGFVLLVMLLGCINYNLSLGYVLTFLLAMTAVMSMLHAFRNLAHLEIRAGRNDAVFLRRNRAIHAALQESRHADALPAHLARRRRRIAPFRPARETESAIAFPL